VPGPISSAEESPLDRCSAIENEAERLRCYDALAAERDTPPEDESDAGPSAEGPLQPDRVGARLSPLAARWELEARAKQGTFKFRPHKQNYLLPLRYSNNPNTQPESPRLGLAPTQDLDNGEAKFQLSFKIKTFEGLFKNHADLWFAYTQQSHWQVYNAATSRPFRETNFEPEFMLVFSTNYNFLGLKGRLLNVGIVHQSNGRSEPLSRSWNRVYVQLGFERGNFTLLLRPWYRFPEDREDDDNSDIDDFLGHGDVQAVYKRGEHTLALLVRNNLTSPNRGAAQLEWSFPGHGHLKGYLQVFTGYGESLIDYNQSQTAVGLGLILTDVL
jgi:phospholipase A1